MRNTLAVVLALLTAAAPLAAAPRQSPLQARTGARPARSTVIDVQRRVDAGRINMEDSNVGAFAYDLATSSPGLEWPKGSNQTAVFASGLWLGCTVGAQVRVAVAEYSQEYGPGPMVGGTFDDPNRPEHIVYKVRAYRGSASDTAHVTRVSSPPEDALVHHSWSEYLAGAKPYGAPTRLWRLPNTATPQPDDSLDVEGPDVLGDQMLWGVHNDADPSLHTNNAGGTAPLGVEVQQTVFAYDRTDAFGDMVFLRFRILNKGANTLENLYASLWSDPDLGGFLDDLVGCDLARSLGFCYNAAPVDAVYGAPPPALGYVLLDGLHHPVTLAPLGLTAFGKYINGTDPATAIQSYNVMQGLHGDGTPVVDPTTGLVTPYFHTGDPVTGLGWLDSVPADRRMLLTSGPTTLAPGGVQEIWAAVVMGRGGDPLGSVATVRCLADLARSAFEAGFAPPAPVPADACSLAAAAAVRACPRGTGFWAGQCPTGGAELDAGKLAQVAGFVNGRSLLFDWPTDPVAQFCAALSPGAPLDPRLRARREYAAFLANYSGSQAELRETNGSRIWLNPGTSITCPPLRAGLLADLATAATAAPVLLDALYLNNITFNRRALEGVPNGLPAFNGGAGPASGFLGSKFDPVAAPDSFTTVELRFDHTTTQSAYRYLRLERQSDGAAPPQGRGYLYGGFHTVPFTCWDLETDEQLDVAFVERVLTDDLGTILAPGFQPATDDSTWGPDDSALGGREYLFVLRRPYSPTPKPAFAQDAAIVGQGVPALYTLWARRRAFSDVVDDGDAFRFVWGFAPSPGVDSLLVELESRSLADPAVREAYDRLTDCLAALNAGAGMGPTCSDGSLLGVATMVHAEARPGRVSLTWQVTAAGAALSVERRLESGEWGLLARLGAVPGGVVSFEDSTVQAGASYRYRLALTMGGSTSHGGEVRVLVPAHATLAVLGARPGPARGRLNVAYSVATRAPARLELLDLAGRRVLARELGALEPGEHVVDLGPTGRFPAGIYLVRITQGARSAAGKAAILH